MAFATMTDAQHATDGIIEVGGNEYRVHAGDTPNPAVYVRIRHMGQVNERRLRHNGATAMRVVSAFRRATRGDKLGMGV